MHDLTGDMALASVSSVVELRANFCVLLTDSFAVFDVQTLCQSRQRSPCKAVMPDGFRLLPRHIRKPTSLAARACGVDHGAG